MSRGPMNVPLKLLAEPQAKLGGTSRVAKILLPQLAAALPIRLVARRVARRIAESRRGRRPI